MGLFNDIVTTATGGVYSPDKGFSAPGLGLYQNTSYGKAATKGVTGSEDLLGQLTGKKDQEAANALNLAEAQRNRDWQERMSSTAYQRAMRDMKEAGLNPMLAYMQGGASSPGGAQAQVQSASHGNLVDKAIGAFTGIGGVHNQASAIQQQGQMNQSSIQLNAATAIQSTANAKKLNAEADRIRTNLPKDKAKSKLYQKADELYDASEQMFKTNSGPTHTQQLYKMKDTNEKNLKNSAAKRDRNAELIRAAKQRFNK